MRAAAYARYSSDQQSAASIDDQLRNCRGYCERMGWPEPVVYQDAAISGARNDRPGYQRLLADAGTFQVIVVDDLSRLSRDGVESQMALRRLAFQGVRVIAVSDGLDTARKDAKVSAGLRGLMNEVYLADLADKTHRGLTGKALAGASAGGLAYGYRVTDTGQRAIREDQAVIVRRIFADYLAGSSARDIAAALNAEGVPSGRGRQWSASAIHGDARRGIGILANPIYVGRQVWNRSRWVKHPETGRRVRQERPRGDWIVSDHPELAVIDAGTWAATERRLRGQSRATGTAGRPPKHVLSGILRCGECGGPMVIIDRYQYGCATAKQRGTCPGIRVGKVVAETALLATVRNELLSEEVFAAYQRALRAAVKPDKGQTAKRLAEARRWHGNVMQAIRAGIITPSTKADLEAAEAAVRVAETEASCPPVPMVPKLRERWDRIVRDLGSYARNSAPARDALIDVIGDSVIVRNENGDLFAEIAASQIALVAGAGFRHGLTQPIRIPLAAGRG